MTTPNERKIRAGYDLFLAADPDVDADWAPDAPVAALMAEDIEWYDDVNQAGGADSPSYRGKWNADRRGGGSADEAVPPDVLARLRQLRREMPYCQILSSFEDETKQIVHTVDHALKSDENGERPQLCASSFEFDQAGKVKTVRYCSRELHLNSPSPEAAH